MDDKLTTLKTILKEKALDGFIITNPTNIFYLTGFKGVSPQDRESILIITSNLATLILPRLYQNEAAKVRSPQLKVRIARERNEIFNLAKRLISLAHPQGELSHSFAHPRGLAIGFEEDDLRFGEYLELNNPGLSIRSKPGLGYVDKPGLKLVPTKNLVENLRVIKTEEEIQKIEKAQIISQKAFEAIIKTLKVGQIEGEIAENLLKIIKSLGGQGLAFKSIVASGPNSGKPHHITSDRRLTINDVLLLDFGTKYQDYCADLSRTVFIGKAHDLYLNIYEHVSTAQKAAIAKICQGLKSSDAYQIVHQYFKKHKLDKYFLHSLGHGVGLEVHEKPHLRPQNTQAGLGIARQARLERKEPYEILQENMVFSVEPGLYFPWGGVRIEDLVVIKNGQTEILGKPAEGIIEI